MLLLLPLVHICAQEMHIPGISPAIPLPSGPEALLPDIAKEAPDISR
jgi:hypothetical protein